MESWSFSQQLIEYFSTMDSSTGYIAILGILFICGLGVPIPEDITLISAGILVSLGTIPPAGAVIAGLVGVMLGDSFLFFVGRRYGKKVFNWPILRTFATPPRIAAAEERIQANGRFICFIARFFPGLRSVIFLSAGTMGVRPIVFFTQDGLAALISVPFWVWFGWTFGNNIDQLLEYAKQLQVGLIIVVFAAIVGYIWWKVRKKKAV